MSMRQTQAGRNKHIVSCRCRGWDARAVISAASGDWETPGAAVTGQGLRGGVKLPAEVSRNHDLSALQATSACACTFTIASSLACIIPSSQKPSCWATRCADPAPRPAAALPRPPTSTVLQVQPPSGSSPTPTSLPCASQHYCSNSISPPPEGCCPVYHFACRCSPQIRAPPHSWPRPCLPRRHASAARCGYTPPPRPASCPRPENASANVSGATQVKHHGLLQRPRGPPRGPSLSQSPVPARGAELPQLYIAHSQHRRPDASSHVDCKRRPRQSDETLHDQHRPNNAHTVAFVANWSAAETGC